MAGKASDVEVNSTSWLVEPQTSSRLLIDEEPLQVLPSLAEMIGLNEALFLQQLHYWLRKSTHHHQGRRWVYNSYPQWQQQLPFWSEHTIRRIVEALKTRGLIVTANFNRVQSDRTMWYSINYDAVAALPTRPPVFPRSGDAASSCVHFGQMDCPKWPGQVSKVVTFPEKDPRKGSTETSSRGKKRTCAHDIPIPVQHPPTTSTKTWLHRMPADYTPSATLRAELESKYPLLHFEEEMEGIHDWEYRAPKSDWDAATRTWFRRAEQIRKEKATTPGQGSGGHWRDATSTDRRTQELMRQHQAALADFNTHVAKHTAMDVNYEDITHDTQRLPGISHTVEPARELLPRPYRPPTGHPAVF